MSGLQVQGRSQGPMQDWTQHLQEIHSCDECGHRQVAAGSLDVRTDMRAEAHSELSSTKQ